MSDSNEAVMRALFAAWGESLEAAAAATREHFADDCVWDQSPIPKLVGPEAAAQFLLSMGTRGIKGVDVDFLNVVSSGDVVCHERIDHVVLADGTRAMSIPVTGVTEFRDGKIAAWREYFDSARLGGSGG